ncbi:hypothetical protein LV89_01942 [Arcicella aurantiaca]|uniref:Uncharacterized protein n=1 Tax=Arcicella aurantiaca TaxID=591202 RepID=A0A316EC12_9BACT|nr:hypothetical protein [Arcicella aurantiaca]PWK27128.1 hypothetical protein LV89_01942 [Arcicella aurantiaca]
MKKLIFTFSLCTFSFLGFSQNALKMNPEIPTSPIMLDFLKNYQNKNAIAKIELPPVGIENVKKSAKEMANIDNLTIVKPNLTELIKMPVVKPEDTQTYHLKIVGEQPKESNTIK